jgi:hypothetical protein
MRGTCFKPDPFCSKLSDDRAWCLGLEYGVKLGHSEAEPQLIQLDLFRSVASLSERLNTHSIS